MELLHYLMPRRPPHPPSHLLRMAGDLTEIVLRGMGDFDLFVDGEDCSFRRTDAGGIDLGLDISKTENSKTGKLKSLSRFSKF